MVRAPYLHENNFQGRLLTLCHQSSRLVSSQAHDQSCMGGIEAIYLRLQVMNGNSLEAASYTCDIALL